MIWKNKAYYRPDGKNPKPFTKDSEPTKMFRVAFLFLEGDLTSTRSDLLQLVGVPKKKAKSKGYNSTMFQVLNANEVVAYDKVKKCYGQGDRYLEYLQYCVNYMVEKGHSTKQREIFLALLKKVSPSVHFMAS